MPLKPAPPWNRKRPFQSSGSASSNLSPSATPSTPSRGSITPSTLQWPGMATLIGVEVAFERTVPAGAWFTRMALVIRRSRPGSARPSSLPPQSEPPVGADAAACCSTAGVEIGFADRDERYARRCNADLHAFFLLFCP